MAKMPIKQKIITDLTKILGKTELTSNEYAALLLKLTNHAMRVRREAMKEKDAEHRIRSKHLVQAMSGED